MRAGRHTHAFDRTVPGNLGYARAPMDRAIVFVVACFALVFCAPACTQGGGGKPQPAAAAEGDGAPKAAAAEPEAEVDPALLDPFAATEQAPETFDVKFETTKGDFVVKVTRAWAPLGADRFYNLVKLGYFQDIAFFRAIDGFMVQFGLHGIPKVTSAWQTAPIKDDPVTQHNERGTITFATSGPNTRTTQLFINFGNNVALDSRGFAPFGKVVEGMEVVDSLYKGYGECAPSGTGPEQGKIQREGNAYLKRRFPELDYIERATLVQGS